MSSGGNILKLIRLMEAQVTNVRFHSARVAGACL